MLKRLRRSSQDSWKSPQVGVRLQAARGQIPLATVEKVTQIYAADLRALEENNWDARRGEAVHKELLLRYANYLGLKLEEIAAPQRVVTWRMAALIALLGCLAGWTIGVLTRPGDSQANVTPTSLPDLTATAAVIETSISAAVQATVTAFAPTVTPTADSTATAAMLQIMVADAVQATLVALLPTATPTPLPTDTPLPPTATPLPPTDTPSPVPTDTPPPPPPVDTPAPVDSPAPAPGPCSKTQPVDRPPNVGECVIVTMEPGLKLTLREQPGAANPPKVDVEPGQKFLIVEGPQNVDNLNWYKLRSEDGTLEGWAPDTDGTARWLRPLE